MQENKKATKKLRERERERERERDNIFVRENYVTNGKEDDKFIIRGCE